MFNINSQLEHLQAKYAGTGHADQNSFEWAVNINRVSYASYIGRHPMLAYVAIAENESIGRERYNFMQKMLLPCGQPPERDEDLSYLLVIVQHALSSSCYALCLQKQLVSVDVC
ncbi:Splicing factor 3B subunit 5 [Rhynchospora pubera]|uniref:Splicing factor 3B subunit 5 n=1 Tax=Rhynchospora pubera TaxID=906938 RepID=A0AAV8CQ02_9POAL|nr:Splicing factor 3B subunit 5 [Rhynchospora pubera]